MADLQLSLAIFISLTKLVSLAKKSVGLFCVVKSPIEKGV